MVRYSRQDLAVGIVYYSIGIKIINNDRESSQVIIQVHINAVMERGGARPPRPCGAHTLESQLWTFPESAHGR